jgi:hypothetical protein
MDESAIVALEFVQTEFGRLDRRAFLGGKKL